MARLLDPSIQTLRLTQASLSRTESGVLRVLAGGPTSGRFDRRRPSASKALKPRHDGLSRS